MSRKKIFFLFFPMFISGVFFGGFLLHAIHTGLKARDNHRLAEIQANESLLILKRLRDGKTNDLIEMMEVQLDGAIVSMKAKSKSSSSYQTLVRAKAYRKEFPRTTKHSGESDKPAEKALSELDQEKK